MNVCYNDKRLCGRLKVLKRRLGLIYVFLNKKTVIIGGFLDV